MRSIESLFTRDTPAIAKRGVHMDLKGLPPTAERFVELLRLFAAARYNVVLVEWEDSFPWTVDERFRSPTAYSPDDVRRFVRVADELGLELIPLVQCLGHMETPLSVDGYQHLREAPDNSSSLNPLHPGSRELVQRMVDDVLTLMPNVRRVHLGGDESWVFGKHPDTAAYIDAHGKGALYLHHVEPILDNLIARGIRPILWHDMMTEWASEPLHTLATKCDLMTWGYRGHPDDEAYRFRTEQCERFHAHGITLWAGTAYKGAGDAPEVSTADRPDPQLRQENALGWMTLATRLDYVGVVATAWSRFNTGTAQCEPIDAALDALLLAGVILHDNAAPAGGVEACIEALAEVGEKDRFLACRDAMHKLTELRRRGWRQVQEARQQLVLARLDPRRASAREPATGLNIVATLAGTVKASDALADEVRRCFAGLVERVWIDEYLATRLVPLKDEYDAIEREMSAL